MAHLRPCPDCERHVRADETRCPFCDASLAADATTPAVPASRLGRAARMAFGAAVATSIVACGNSKPPNDGSTGSGTMTESSASATATATGTVTPPPPPPDGDNGGPAKPYGAPPADGLLV